MNKYRYIFLIWLLPAYFLTMSVYQLLVYKGINQTYDSGESYIADVIDFDVKQIAAQTSGYVVLAFDRENGDHIQERLSLSVQMAQVIMNSERIPVRYNPDSFSKIVIINTFNLQKKVIRVNLAVLLFGLVVTTIVSIFSSRYARHKIHEGDHEMVIERLDNDNS